MSLFGGIELVDRPCLENIRKLDVLPLPIIGQMQRYGIRIDPDHFKELSFRLCERMDELRADITCEIPPDKLEEFVELSYGEEDEDTDGSHNGDSDVARRSDFDLSVDSSAQVARLLFDVLSVHLSTSKVDVKQTKSGKLSTGKKTLEQFKKEYPVVRLILEYRECAKMKGTYADSMPRRARWHPRGPDCPACGRRHYSDEYRVHTTITTTRTATGRIASKNPNLANIPARTVLGREIRMGFIASDGHVIVQRDWAQIELRILADLSGDPVMLDIYRSGGDIHMETAMRTFGLTDPSQVDKLLHRAPAKNVNFATVYLITGLGLLDLMAVTYATAGVTLPDWMDETWCDRFIDKWFSIYTNVRPYLNSEEEKIRRHGISWTRCGRVRRIPETRSFFSYVQDAGVRQGSNHAIQGFNADLAKLAMGEMFERFEAFRECGIESYPLMHIYDEFLIEAPEEYGEIIELEMADVMDNVLTDKQTGVRMSKVPIKSDGHLLTRWQKE